MAHASEHCAHNAGQALGERLQGHRLQQPTGIDAAISLAPGANRTPMPSSAGQHARDADVTSFSPRSQRPDELIWFEDEPDTRQWSYNEIGEHLYQRYRAYEERWRRHVGPHSGEDHAFSTAGAAHTAEAASESASWRIFSP